jgi:hypothetical protein
VKGLFCVDLVGKNTHDRVVLTSDKRDLGEIVAVTLHKVVDVAVAHDLIEVFVLDSP